MSAVSIALPQLKTDEGFKSKAYPDPLSGGDPWTVGYGATGKGIVKGTVWTMYQAERDLLARVLDIAADLDKHLPWWRLTLNDARGAVLINMAYNMGVDGLLKFKNTLEFIRTGQFGRAAEGMLASLWAKQVPKRAARLAQQMRTGVVA